MAVCLFYCDGVFSLYFFNIFDTPPRRRRYRGSGLEKLANAAIFPNAQRFALGDAPIFPTPTLRVGRCSIFPTTTLRVGPCSDFPNPNASRWAMVQFSQPQRFALANVPIFPTPNVNANRSCQRFPTQFNKMYLNF